MFFFCKHKTAYEMRISDGSSDVCSSDRTPDPVEPPAQGPGGRGGRLTRTGPTDHVKNCVSWQADHVGKSPATFVPGGVLSLAFAGGVHRPASLPETNLARRLPQRINLPGHSPPEAAVIGWPGPRSPAARRAGR